MTPRPTQCRSKGLVVVLYGLQEPLFARIVSPSRSAAVGVPICRIGRDLLGSPLRSTRMFSF